jgi:signal transduction histidine kinase
VQKYALEGSRVYIDMKEVTTGYGPRPAGFAPMTMLEVKNVSQARLNIPADELMERFKRGDDSRSTEGSGLGLAIARDLIHLQGGFFEIAIDGDLFKATSLLETWTAQEE